jgi:hypothetical protein
VKKYEIHNQVTGLLESADTFEEALVLQAKIKQEYLEFQKDLFVISVLEELPDGSWRQGLSDAEGNMLKPVSPYTSWVWNGQNWSWEAPISFPTDGKPYQWDEQTTSWVEIT